MRPTGSPAQSFIRSKVEKEFEILDREKVTPWAFLTSNGISIDAPDGTLWFYSSMEFEGSIRDSFWKSFLRPFIEDIVERSFVETRRLCQEQGVSVREPLKETGMELHKGLETILARMVDIDRRLRGKGFPKNVQPADPTDLRREMEAIIDTRLQGELGLPNTEPAPENLITEWASRHPIWTMIIAFVVGNVVSPVVQEIAKNLAGKINW